jgi:hypothetical protein
MELFIIIEFNLCDDPFYGYNEHLHSIHLDFDYAKNVVDSLLKKHDKYIESSYEEYFIRIIKMEIGNTKQVIVFDSTESIEKK